MISFSPCCDDNIRQFQHVMQVSNTSFSRILHLNSTVLILINLFDYSISNRACPTPVSDRTILEGTSRRERENVRELKRIIGKETHISVPIHHGQWNREPKRDSPA